MTLRVETDSENDLIVSNVAAGEKKPLLPPSRKQTKTEFKFSMQRAKVQFDKSRIFFRLIFVNAGVASTYSMYNDVKAMM